MRRHRLIRGFAGRIDTTLLEISRHGLTVLLRLHICFSNGLKICMGFILELIIFAFFAFLNSDTSKVYIQNELSSPIAANFCPTIFGA